MAEGSLMSTQENCPINPLFVCGAEPSMKILVIEKVLIEVRRKEVADELVEESRGSVPDPILKYPQFLDPTMEEITDLDPT